MWIYIILDCAGEPVQFFHTFLEAVDNKLPDTDIIRMQLGVIGYEMLIGDRWYK